MACGNTFYCIRGIYIINEFSIKCTTYVNFFVTATIIHATKIHIGEIVSVIIQATKFILLKFLVLNLSTKIHNTKIFTVKILSVNIFQLKFMLLIFLQIKSLTAKCY